MEADVTGLGDREHAAVRSDAQALHDHLTTGGGLGNWLFRPKVVKECRYLVESVRLDGSPANTPDVLQRLVHWCDLGSAMDRLFSMWNPLVSTVPGDMRLQLAAFRDLHLILAKVLELNSALEGAKRAMEAIPSVGLPEWQDPAAAQEMLALVRAALAHQKLTQAIAEVNGLRHAVRSTMPSGRSILMPHDFFARLTNVTHVSSLRQGRVWNDSRRPSRTCVRTQIYLDGSGLSLLKLPMPSCRTPRIQSGMSDSVHSKRLGRGRWHPNG